MAIQKIISALGGKEAAAACCGVSVDAIRKWETFGKIPPKHWPTIVQAGASSFSELSGVTEAA